MQSIEILKRLALLDRDRIERVLEDVLDLRAGNRFDQLVALTTTDVSMEVVGDRRRFAFAGRYDGQAAVIAAHYRMHVDVEFFDQTVADRLVDQDRAFLRRIVRVRHRGTGQVCEHEIWDLLRFRDGLISHMTKFIDANAFEGMQRD